MTSIPPLRILYVDDDLDYALLFKLALSRAGYQVSTRQDPRAALNALADIDLLVSDYRMPGMNGIELIRAARAQAPDLRCALISSDPGAVDPQAAAAAGAIISERKPEKVEEFAAFVARACG